MLLAGFSVGFPFCCVVTAVQGSLLWYVCLMLRSAEDKNKLVLLNHLHVSAGGKAQVVQREDYCFKKS